MFLSWLNQYARTRRKAGCSQLPSSATRVSGAVRPSARELTTSSQTVGRGEFLFATSWSLLPCEYNFAPRAFIHIRTLIACLLAGCAAPRPRGSSQFRAIESMTPPSPLFFSRRWLLLLQGRKKRDESVEPSKFQRPVPKSIRKFRVGTSAVCCYFYREAGCAFCPQKGAKTAQSYIWRAAPLTRMGLSSRPAGRFCFNCLHEISECQPRHYAQLERRERPF